MTSEIKVDTISENTSANGVTIDGLTIKDGNIIGDVALAGTTPTFTVGDGGAEDAALIFDGNAVDYYIALDDSADNLIIGSGSTVGSNSLITIDSDGDFTLDSAGDIILDAADNQIFFKDAGTTVGTVTMTGSDLKIISNVNDKDMIFAGTDNNSEVVALTLDMSAAGAATFNGKITADAGIDIDNFNIDGTTIALSSGDITVDAAGRIDLSADDNGEIRLFDGSSQYAQFKDDSDRLTIQGMIADKDMHFVVNNGGSEATPVVIGSVGAVTKPLQPAFSARNNATQSNIDNNTLILFGAETFDIGSNFANDHTFTAPVTGKYQLNAMVRMDNLDSSGTWVAMTIQTSNRNYTMLNSASTLDTDSGYWTFTVTALADLDANDTANVLFNKSGGSATGDATDGAAHFNGFLAC